MSESGLGPGSDIEAVDQREEPGGQNENRDDAEEGPDPDAAGAHGRDFAVSGEAA